MWLPWTCVIAWAIVAFAQYWLARDPGRSDPDRGMGLLVAASVLVTGVLGIAVIVRFHLREAISKHHFVVGLERGLHWSNQAWVPYAAYVIVLFELIPVARVIGERIGNRATAAVLDFSDSVAFVPLGEPPTPPARPPNPEIPAGGVRIPMPDSPDLVTALLPPVDIRSEIEDCLRDVTMKRPDLGRRLVDLGRFPGDLTRKPFDSDGKMGYCDYYNHCRQGLPGAYSRLPFLPVNSDEITPVLIGVNRKFCRALLIAGLVIMALLTAFAIGTISYTTAMVSWGIASLYLWACYAFRRNVAVRLHLSTVQAAPIDRNSLVNRIPEPHAIPEPRIREEEIRALAQIMYCTECKGAGGRTETTGGYYEERMVDVPYHVSDGGPYGGTYIRTRREKKRVWVEARTTYYKCPACDESAWPEAQVSKKIDDVIRGIRDHNAALSEIVNGVRERNAALDWRESQVNKWVSLAEKPDRRHGAQTPRDGRARERGAYPKRSIPQLLVPVIVVAGVIAAANIIPWAVAQSSNTSTPLYSTFRSTADPTGVWGGTVRLHDQHADAIILTIGRCTQHGAVCATTRYPFLGCKGRLVFLGAHAHALSFRERITGGRKRCSDTSVKLSLANSGLLRWRQYQLNGKLVDQGDLSRTG